MSLLPSRKRLAASAAAAAVIGATALVAGPVTTAQAATHTCDASEFCLYFLHNRAGGLYEYSGSDSNLGNDHFENQQTNVVVSNESWSAWNRGTGSSYADVLVSFGTSSSGRTACIKQGRVVNDLGAFNNQISSYKWVSRGTCNTYPQL